jgi:SAM-dependent methyltransferase
VIDARQQRCRLRMMSGHGHQLTWGIADLASVGAVGDESANRRKESFDRVAEHYNSYRSGYPVEVVDALVVSSHLREGSRVLEIGCGTGQLSVPLAERGVDLLALELGPNLAAFARKNLARFERANVVVGAFEEWRVPDRRFDAVVSANAFHWLDPELRFSKSADALKVGGFLAIGHAHHVRGGTPGFFEDTQEFYLKWGLSDDPFFQPTSAADAPVMYTDLDQRPEFRLVRRQRFEIPRQFTTESYVGWLMTDSLVSSIGDDARQGFLNDIGHLVDAKYQGTVSRNWVYEIITAQKAKAS